MTSNGRAAWTRRAKRLRYVAGLPSEAEQQALNLLNQWKAVRLVTSIASVSTRTLEEQGWIERLPTLIGKAFILTPEGRHVIGESRRTVSDTVAANALYRQDARPYLQKAGYHTLRPGKGKFCVVSTEAGVPCPLLGRVTGQGYSWNHVRETIEERRIDLMLARARLVVVMPVQVAWKDNQLEVIYAPPRWK